MPWELTALPADGQSSLGTIEHVQALLRTAIPEVELFRDVSGAEKIRSMESAGVEIPVAIREHWLQSAGAFQGMVRGGGFTLDFHLGDVEAAVASVGIDVRGDGNDAL